MNKAAEGKAIVYCEGAFNTPNGKTAHGLVRYTQRYNILSIIDSRYAGKDAGMILDGKNKGIPVFDRIEQAFNKAKSAGIIATHLVVGLAPDGGRLSSGAREDIKEAITLGLNIDCGLHDYLSEDREISGLASEHHVNIRDIRKPKPIDQLHFFSGKIDEVKALKVAVLGTDSAVGKRTTARILTNALLEVGEKAEMIGTGQTAWLQGAQHCIVLDSIINDFVSGEIEHAVWSAWMDTKPDYIIIEGQGSLLNPAYPGGFELLAAGRPDAIILQHAPARIDYDGFPGFCIHPLSDQIKAIEIISGKPVIAITINHEKLDIKQIPFICDAIEMAVGLPTLDVLLEGADKLVKLLKLISKKRSV
ncbi:MAG: DUF1611 domain-containing protein [candidate division Zixibacteria bacterium]|nr:DUF1611 domain-containing protein [candidate division Zixibacteria bacterium]